MVYNYLCYPDKQNVCRGTIYLFNHFFMDFDWEEDKLPSLDFIAGLVTGEGSFIWVKQNGTEVPVFTIKMHSSERLLLTQVLKKLELKEKLHEYHYGERQYVTFLVRKRSVLEDKVIPIFKDRLYGKKKAQFYIWLEKYNEKKADFVYKQHSR